MKTDSIQDSTRYLVGEKHLGSIMPGSRAEMLRDVYLQSGANVKGGIYCSELHIEGSDIIVDGAVYCKSNIIFDQLDKTPEKQIEFSSTIVCPGSILTPKSGAKIKFLSDIYSGKINFKNCIVYGNVYATSAALEDSIILGGIYCRNELKIKNSIVSTFRSNQCHILDHVSILSPFGFAEKINLESNVNVLTFNNIFSTEEKVNSGVLKLDETDIYEIELDKKEADSDSETKKIQVLSVAERLLNTTEIIKHFKQNRNFIEFLSLNSHLAEEEKKNFSKGMEKEIEEKLWKIIKDKTDLNLLEGYQDINEMFQSFEEQKIDQKQ